MPDRLSALAEQDLEEIWFYVSATLPVRTASRSTRSRNPCMLSARVIGLPPSAFPGQEKQCGRIGQLALVLFQPLPV